MCSDHVLDVKEISVFKISSEKEVEKLTPLAYFSTFMHSVLQNKLEHLKIKTTKNL